MRWILKPEPDVDETAALFRVSRALAQIDNEQEMFELVLTEYLQNLNLQQGGVLILDEDKAYGVLEAHMVAGKLVEPFLEPRLRPAARR